MVNGWDQSYMQIGELKDMNQHVPDRKFQIRASIHQIPGVPFRLVKIRRDQIWHHGPSKVWQMRDTRHGWLIGCLRPQGIELHRQEIERLGEALLELRLDDLHAGRLEDLSEFGICPCDTAILTVVHILSGEMGG